MKIEELKELIDTGREIEFAYNDKLYSITYFETNGQDKISFCEFFKDPTDVDTIDELLNIEVNNKKLKDILISLSESAFNIY